MLRDYQEEICSRVREAFKKHRSVMMQMPTGTGKTVVLAEIVREYLNVNVNVNVKGGCNVLIVAHRRELVAIVCAPRARLRERVAIVWAARARLRILRYIRFSGCRGILRR